MEPEVSSLYSQDPATCPDSEPDRSMPPHSTSQKSILILSSHLRLGLPSGLIHVVFPPKALYAPLLSRVHTTCPAHLSLLGV
jgi:hypothetical protein